MNNTGPPKIKGRNIGLAILVSAQIFVGAIHVFFAIWLLSSPQSLPSTGPAGPLGGAEIYSIYTLVFGLLSAVFGLVLWLQKRIAWIATVSTLAFVIVADSLTLLDMPSIPGIPKLAGFGEISYSVLAILYLLQTHIRKSFNLVNH